MAKVSFTKLGLKINNEVKNVVYGDQVIEVKQYVPINEKLDLISNVLNFSADDMKFYNVGKINIYLVLEMIYTYTNINFTDKQKEDTCKLYDMIVSSGLYETIMNEIPQSEYDYIFDTLMETVESIYAYTNSVLGILDAVTEDYDNLKFDATSIQEKLGDPANMALLKSIMTQLG
jgi:hypothetical protein